ncbi:MAG: hypothetical protein ACRC4M_02315, partial [Mycoplasma sp.]
MAKKVEDKDNFESETHNSSAELNISLRRSEKLELKFTKNSLALSLKPNDNLFDSAKYDIYKMYLKEIFHDEELRNIAITGVYGSGKSSLIYSYLKHDNNMKKHA